MTEKIDHKKIKGPDAFQVRLISMFDWGLKNRNMVGLMLLPLVGVVVAGFGWQWYSGYRMDLRLDSLAVVEDVYTQELFEAGKKREEIQKKIDGLAATATPEAPKAADAKAGKPGEVSAPAKPVENPQLAVQRKILEIERDGIKPDHSKSLEQFKKYFEGHKDTAEGWMAGMRAVSILLEQQKEADARPIVESVAKDSITSPIFQIQSRMILIGLNEDAGNFDAALKDAEVLIGLADEELKPKVLLAKGRIQMLKDAKTEAKATLDDLIVKHANTPEAQKARSMLALIN
jgi:hypothetical protein